jgi:threonine/homoserine efflux transporter RhtA
MIDMPRGLLIRGIAVVLGAAPLRVLLYVVDASSAWVMAAGIFYAAVAGVFFANYFVEHEDEISTRSALRERQRAHRNTTSSSL